MLAVLFAAVRAVPSGVKQRIEQFLKHASLLSCNSSVCIDRLVWKPPPPASTTSHEQWYLHSGSLACCDLLM